MLHVDDDSLVVTTLDAETVEVRSSLLLPLLPLDATTITGSVDFYSGTAGAFIDLADDARWIFNLDGLPCSTVTYRPPQASRWAIPP